jgi:hypothetical protein
MIAILGVRIDHIFCCAFQKISSVIGPPAVMDLSAAVTCESRPNTASSGMVSSYFAPHQILNTRFHAPQQQTWRIVPNLNIGLIHLGFMLSQPFVWISSCNFYALVSRASFRYLVPQILVLLISMVLGPLDCRALKTRCQACASRRIKVRQYPSSSRRSILTSLVHRTGARSMSLLQKEEDSLLRSKGPSYRRRLCKHKA